MFMAWLGKIFRREYSIWLNSRFRCRNPTSKDFPIYGGAGIRFYEPWNDFEVFLADVGPMPPGATHLARIDRKRSYVPGNVVWSTDVPRHSPPRFCSQPCRDKRRYFFGKPSLQGHCIVCGARIG